MGVPLPFAGPGPITEEIRVREDLPELRGPVTARQAFEVVLPRVEKIDRDFKFVLVTSGQDINHEGRALLWEFFFDFPRGRATGISAVQLRSEEEIDRGAMCVETHVRPAYPDTGFMPLLKRDRASRAYLERAWDKSVKAKRGLPLSFRDSPEAVRDLAGQGADWIAGDTSMTLSSKVLASGEIVWSTVSWDKEFHTSFEAIR